MEVCSLVDSALKAYPDDKHKGKLEIPESLGNTYENVIMTLVEKHNKRLENKTEKDI